MSIPAKSTLLGFLDQTVKIAKEAGTLTLEG
jgi:hypothetical protein